MTKTIAASRTRLLFAFAAIYLIWGSTYVAIRVAVAALPPFALAGARFMVAGGLLYLWLTVRGAQRATPRQWLDNLIAGALLLVGGNGLVVWAEQAIPSGITTLLISIGPLFMILIDWSLPRGTRPTWPTFVGLALGFSGLVLLIGAGTGGAPLDLARCATVLLACLSWSAGSLYSRYTRSPAEPLTAATLQMLLGGALMAVISGLRGELAGFHLDRVPTLSLLAWGYLVVAGSLITFPCYVYLLKHSTPARVSTYAYVNPIVAVVLGALLLKEPVTARTVIASVIIVVAVAIITTQRSRSAGRKT